MIPRFVTTFKPAGTKSYRLSATKFLGRYGGNGQNPAPCVLRLLQARAGHKLVQPDQSGAEALIVANLAPAGRYRQLFEFKIKPHTFLALHLFAKDPLYEEAWFKDTAPAEAFLQADSPEKLASIPDWPVVRDRIQDTYIPYYIGKRTAHARSYKMGWKTFQRSVLRDSEGRVALTAAQAKEFLETFDLLFPEIQVWQDEVIFLAHRERQLENLFGYPRRFERTFTSGYDREIVSWIPQSTVGCLTTEAIFKIEDYIDAHKKRWNLLNQKHDSLLLEVPDADVLEAAKISVEAIKSFELVGRDGVKFRMKSAVQIGDNWGKYGKDNPGGMKEIQL